MGRPVGWILDDVSRKTLLAKFPPRYAEIVAHHVTLWSRKFGKPVPARATFEVVGHADDGRGIEALVVAVNGTTDRPDGSTYHVTWSIDPQSGQKPKHSNDLIAEAGWTSLDSAIQFTAEPDFL